MSTHQKMRNFLDSTTALAFARCIAKKIAVPRPTTKKKKADLDNAFKT